MDPKVLVLCLVGAAAGVGVGYATGVIGGGDEPGAAESIFHDADNGSGTKTDPRSVVFDEASDCDNYGQYEGYDSRDTCLRENFLDDAAQQYGGPADPNYQDPFFTNPLENLPLTQGIQEPVFDDCERMINNGTQDAQQIRDCLNEVLDETQALIEATDALYGTNGLLVTDNPELAVKSAQISADIETSCIPEGKNFGDFLQANGNNATQTLNNFYQNIVVCLGALEAQQDIASGVDLTAQDAGIASAFNQMSSVWGETLQAYSATVAAKFGNQYAARDLQGIKHHIGQ